MDGADVFASELVVVGGLFVADAAQEGIVLPGGHMVALAGEGVPHLCVFGGAIPSQYHDALAVGEGVADEQS